MADLPGKPRDADVPCKGLCRGILMSLALRTPRGPAAMVLCPTVVAVGFTKSAAACSRTSGAGWVRKHSAAH
jgi:hypothetical protein